MYKCVSKGLAIQSRIERSFTIKQSIFDLGKYKQKFRQDKSLNRFISNHIQQKVVQQTSDRGHSLADIQLFINKVKLKCNDKDFNKVWEIIQVIKNDSQNKIGQNKLEKLLIQIGLDEMISFVENIEFEQITETMFYHDDLNKEQEFDQQKQIEKFNDFKTKVQPKFNPIFQKLSYKHNPMENEELEIVQTSRINNQQNHQNNFNFDDFKYLQNQFKEQPFEEELIDEEGYYEMNDIQQDDTLLSQKFQQDLIESTQQKMDFNTHMIQNDDRRFENKYSLMKYVNIDDVTLTQKGFNTKDIKNTNFIYCFGLPFDISEDSDYIKNFIKSIETKKGSIKSIKLVSLNEKYFGQQIRNHVDTKNRISVDPFQNMEQYGFMNMIQDNFTKELNKKQQEHDQKIQQLLQQDVYQISVNNMIRTKKITNKINKMMQMNMKSYMFIECNSQEQKEEIFNNTLRVFGIRFNGYNIKFDDADYKRTLKITNMPFNISRKEVVDQINTIFSANHVQNLMIEENQSQQDEEYNINCGCIMIRFNSFEETLQAYEILNQSTLNNRVPTVDWYQGHLKKDGDQFSEPIDDYMHTINARLYKNFLLWSKVQKNIQSNQNQNQDFYKDYFEENQFIQDHLNQDIMEEELDEE